MFIVDDRHGLWQLFPLHGFEIDGTMNKGCYFKKPDSAIEALPTLTLAPSLISIEASKEFIAEKNLSKRHDMLARPDGKYRGTMMFATIAETSDYNFGELYNEMESVRNAYEVAYAETVGHPLSGEPDPGLGLPSPVTPPGYTPPVEEHIEPPATPVTPVTPSPGTTPSPVESLPKWQKVKKPDGSSFASRQEWINAGRPQK